LLRGHETREALVPVSAIDDHGCVRSDLVVEDRGKPLRMSHILLCGGKLVLFLVTNMILDINLCGVDAIQASV
jgi:hypothetical protein